MKIECSSWPPSPPDLVAEFSERDEDGRLVVDTVALNEHLHNIGPKWDLLTFMGLRETPERDKC